MGVVVGIACPFTPPAARAFLGNTALVAKTRGRYDEALAALEASLQAKVGDAGKATVHNNLSNLYRSLGRHPQAIASLKRIGNSVLPDYPWAT